MHIERDYTGQDVPVLETQEFDRSGRMGQLLTAACRKHLHGRFWPVPEKRERILEFYNRLGEVAYINGGKVTLDIDEESGRAELCYWGALLILSELVNGTTKRALQELLESFDMICIEPENGGIKISVRECLADVRRGQ